MAEPISIQQLKNASEDAISLAEFIYKPTGFMVTRRLAPSINTLQYYIDSFDAAKTEAEGKVAYIETTVQDAINNTAIEGGVLADTFVVVDGSLSQRTVNKGLESVADLSTINNPKNGLRVYVKSYHTGLGKGGGYFIYDSSKESVNDGGLVFNGWIREGSDNYIYASWFGVSYTWNAETHGMDDTQSFIKALRYCIKEGKTLYTDEGFVRLTSLVINQDDAYKATKWHSNNTTLVVDHGGSGIEFRGGVASTVIAGLLNVTNSPRFAPDVSTSPEQRIDGSKFGVCFTANTHEANITVTGFSGVGVLFDAPRQNMNRSVHTIHSSGNILGVLVRGPSPDFAVVRSTIRTINNYQEGIYVGDETNLRHWEMFWYAEDNLKGVQDRSRYSLYLGGNPYGCTLTAYAEQYANDDGTRNKDLYVSPVGSVTLLGGLRSTTDSISGGSTAIIGNTIMQDLYGSPKHSRKALPLVVQGRGVIPDSETDEVRMSVRGNVDLGHLSARYGAFSIESANSTNSVSVRDDYTVFNNSRIVATNRVRLTDDNASQTLSVLRLPYNQRYYPLVYGNVRVIFNSGNLSTGQGTEFYDYDITIVDSVLTVIKKNYDTSSTDTSQELVAVGSSGGYINGLDLQVGYNSLRYGSRMIVSYCLDLVYATGI